MRKMTFWSVLVVVGLVAGGCGSGGGGRMEAGAEAIEGMRDMQKQLTEARGVVVKSMASMDQLRAAADVPKAYKGYASAVEDVEDEGATARKRWDSMRAKGNAYVAKWEKEAEGIQGGDIRSGMERRRAAVREHFDEVAGLAGRTREAYQPYLRDLQEIRKAVSIDMSRDGVEAVGPAMGRAKENGQRLVAEVDALQAKINEIATGMEGRAKSK